MVSDARLATIIMLPCDLIHCSHSSEIAVLMTQRCGTPFNQKDISIALHESNFVLNKVANRAYESNSIAQGAFVGRIELSGFTIDQYVFMDEVGTDSRCTNCRH